MQRWTRKAAAAATAVVLATGSIGCSDDDANRLLSNIFINLLGAGQYSSVSVTIDPNDIGAFIDTSSCDLASALNGCDLSVAPAGFETVTTDNGIVVSTTFPVGPVTVTIDNCPNPIQAFSNLAQCSTTEIAGNIQQTVQGSGTCAPGSQCDQNPLICVTTDGPNATCGVAPPTSSTTSSSSTSMRPDTTTTSSTTSSSSTSTTMDTGGGLSCLIEFSVTNDVGLVGALSYNTDYSGADGTFEGQGSAVSCSNLVGLLGQFNDQDAQTNLISAIIDSTGFATPTAVAECTFLTNGLTAPAAGDFAIVVTDASDPDINPINPTVEITAIVCDTPTTTSTSTTVGPGSTTSSTSTSTESSTTSSTTVTTMSTTTTTGGGTLTNYDVFFAIGEAESVGALQFDVPYSTVAASTQGAFVGAGQAADCEVLVNLGVGFPAFNNCIGPAACGALPPDVLVAAITSVSGFATTAGEQIVRCTWASVTAPTPADFVVNVVDASNPATEPISVTMTVDEVTAQ